MPGMGYLTELGQSNAFMPSSTLPKEIPGSQPTPRPIAPTIRQPQRFQQGMPGMPAAPGTPENSFLPQGQSLTEMAGLKPVAQAPSFDAGGFDPVADLMGQVQKSDPDTKDRFADHIAGSGPVKGMVSAAKRLEGVPYVWGAEGRHGTDCSGLVYWAAKKAGYNLPRSTAAGYMQMSKPVSKQQLSKGDLVFFDYGRLGGAADHVGIYMGKGRMIAASSSADKVRTQAVDWGNFIGGGSIAGRGGHH